MSDRRFCAIYKGFEDSHHSSSAWRCLGHQIGSASKASMCYNTCRIVIWSKEVDKLFECEA